MGRLRFLAGRLLRSGLPRSLQRRLRRLRANTAGRRRERARAAARRRFGTFGAEDLGGELETLGVRTGGVLLVQSSYDGLLTYAGGPLELLAVLRRRLGAGGTLMMPAHPEWTGAPPPHTFDVARTPSATGLLCELFRREPGTLRSLHPTHSACAAGPLARELLADHHRDERSCGPASPYARLLQHDGQILGLGLEPAYTTFLHVVEDLDLGGYPLRLYEEKETPFAIVDQDGHREELRIHRRRPSLMARIDVPRLARQLSGEAVRVRELAGVPVWLADCRTLHAELEALVERGLLVYA